MSSSDHWNKAYTEKSEAELSWHEDDPAVALDLMKDAGLSAASSVIDIGAGTSRLMERLLDLGLEDLTALDLSQQALAEARQRLGAREKQVKWVVGDITSWAPTRCYDIWHDRAVFHFLVEPEDRAAYVQRLSRSLEPGGHALIATFATDGPEKCSGLPVARYSPESLGETLGNGFSLINHRFHLHHTPWGKGQSVQYSLFRREG